MEDIICPFCNEGDFDLIGLKNHLLSGHCHIFDETISIEQERHLPGKFSRPDKAGEDPEIEAGVNFIMDTDFGGE